MCFKYKISNLILTLPTKGWWNVARFRCTKIQFPSLCYVWRSPEATLCWQPQMQKKTNTNATVQIEIQTQYLSLCYVKVTRSHTKAPIKLRRQLNENFTDILDICQIRAGPVFCGANPKYAADWKVDMNTEYLAYWSICGLIIFKHSPKIQPHPSPQELILSNSNSWIPWQTGFRKKIKLYNSNIYDKLEGKIINPILQIISLIKRFLVGYLWPILPFLTLVFMTDREM